MTKSCYSEQRRERVASRPQARQTWMLGLTWAWVCLAGAWGIAPGARAQTLMGEQRSPDNRAVVNFRALAEVEKSLHLPLRMQTNRPPPMPLPFLHSRSNNPAGAPAFNPAAAPAAPFQPAAIQPSPPPVASFPALVDDLTVEPPDTHGAVGPNHIMTTLNSQIRIQDRNGGVISTVSLNTFWQATGVLQAFDPRVLYDPFAKRWMFSAGGDGQTTRSSVLLAVSQTSDPTGLWYLTRIKADQQNLSWADYPGIGFNKDWIVVTVNMFPLVTGLGFDFTGVNLYVFNKTNLYANGNARFTLIQDISTIGFTLVPAVTFDDALPTLHLVEVDDLIHNFTGTTRRLRLSTITGPIGQEVLTLGSAFTTDTNVWGSSEPFLSTLFFGGFAPQLGTTERVECNDARIINLVYRNGTLWCAHTVFLPAAVPDHTAVQWWQLATNGTTVQFGRIDDPQGNTFYAFPSIGVNRNGDALIGFSRFSANQFPSANYAYRSCSDPENVLRSDVVLKDGEDFYSKFPFFFENRWGDYSATMVDPVNDLDFWTIQEYAASATNLFGLPFGRWGTWWGKVQPTETCQKIEFVSSIYNVDENTPGVVTVDVLNIGGAPGTVQFSTSDGTAIAGDDYIAASGTLTFQAGQIQTNFTVFIKDNAVQSSNKFFNVTLSNPSGPATLGRITNAIVVIQDDETVTAQGLAGEFNFSSYLNGGFAYTFSEFESFPDLFCGREGPAIVLSDTIGGINIGGGDQRDPPGTLITVVRTGGSTGRVLVDYETAEGGTAVPFVDYTPVSGTLVFDDYQMSTNFLVEIFPEAFTFLGTNFFSPGLRFIRLVLSNPRPAPEEEAERPGFLRPTVGLGKESIIQVHDLESFGLTNAFMFERRVWRVDEYAQRNHAEPYRVFLIQVLNPSAEAGDVILRTRQAYGGAITPPAAPGFPPGTWIDTSISSNLVQAGSDVAEAAFPGAWQGITRWTPNQVITDPALTTITNYSDYLATNFILHFNRGICRRNVEIVITNDTTVEFNEDLWMELIQIDGQPPVHPFGWWTDITIMYDDQPAGALDREWNVYNLASSDPPFNRAPGTDGLVRSLAVQPDGKTVFGGDFIHANAIRSPGLARFTTNGAYDVSFVVGDGVDGFVTSVVLYSSNSVSFGRVLIGGEFNSYNSQERRRIARLLPNGQLDPSFNPGSGANGTIWSIALQSDDKILVAGSFTEFNDQAYSGVVRLNADGSVDPTFNVGTGAAGTVWSVGVAFTPGVGDQAVLGGDFIFFNSEFHSGIVRLNPDGSTDLGFDTGGGVNGSVLAVAVQADGRVVAGGTFNQINARSRINIARFNTDGSLDASFNGGFGPDGPILTITLQPDGKALIGGPFSSYNGTRRMGFARLRLNGTLDTSFLDTGYNQFAGLPRTFSFEPQSYAATLAVQPDGNIMVGGSFTNIGGNASLRTPLRNTWTVFTRADKQVRFNIARVLGGATPGPGNAEFDVEEYNVNENADLASVKLQRTDGRLGTLLAVAEAADRVATNGIDYTVTNKFNLWPENLVGFPNAEGPHSIGQVAPSFFRIPILNDTLQEGDETVGLSFVRPDAFVLLSGEFIPLGGALGRANAVLNIADDDVNHGIFNFATFNYFTNENAGTAFITVIRTNGVQGLVTVQAFTRQGGLTPRATPGVDYQPVPLTTLVFPPGITSQTFQITIIDDNLVEPDKNIELVLTNATGGAKLVTGAPTSVTTALLTIVDNDFPPGHLNFSASTIVTNEDAGFATVTVTRSGGSVGAVSVQYGTADGTATAPADYLATAGTLSWNDGDSRAQAFTIPLVADGIVDGPPAETVFLRLFNPLLGTVPTPALLGGRTNATLVINEADSFGTLAFNQSFYEADENAGMATITVVRRNGLAGNVSVNYTVTPTFTYVPGEDYVPTAGTLNFAPGESSKTFSITLLDDNIADGPKSLILTLSGAINAVLGAPNPVTLTIVDNESVNTPAGELDTAFREDTQTDGPIYGLALQPDGNLLIAGEFFEVDNVTRTRLARVKPDGQLDPSFDPGIGANGAIRALVLQPDSKMLIGGFFTQYNGTNRGGVARVNNDGTVDSFFVTGSGANNAVYAVALDATGKILVGGSFSSFNGTVPPRPAIVRLNTNGVVDLAFGPGAGPDNTVYAIAVQPDGKILIGGEFTAVDGQSRQRLARLNRNGSVDQTFDPGVINGAVRAIVVQPDGKIAIGGSFTVAGSVSLNYLARFNRDGTLDAGFLPPPTTGADGAVLALALQVDGKLLVAGDFRTFNGVTRNRLTRLNPDGTTDPTINFGNGANSFVAALTIQPDRKIFLAGGFTTYDDRPRPHLARIHGGAIAGNGALEFSQAQFVVSENVTNAQVTIRRRFGTAGTVSVFFDTLDLTAEAGRDYQATMGTATFPPGETRFTFQVPILDNAGTNDDLLVGLELVDSSFVGGATNGPQPVSSLLILDDEITVGFASAGYDVGENVPSGFAPIQIRRHGGTNVSASVQFSTSNGTATAGLDYIATNALVTFLPGETNKTIQVRILNDPIVEPNETVLLSLTAVGNSVVLGQSSATLLIREDDFAPGQFVFSPPTALVSEDAGFVLLTILRTNGSSGVASVRLSTVNNTAFAGLDYGATNIELAFADGVTAISVAIPIVDDLLVEPDETFNAVLSNPAGGATLGPQTTATITIHDDDMSSIVPSGYQLLSESISNNNIIDPNEVVTMALGLRNRGSADTVNLVATLLTGNGVTQPNPVQQSYGVLVANGAPVERNFSFRAVGNVGDRLVVTLLLTDNGVTNGSATYPFTIGGQATRTFGSTNRTPILINDTNVATPYPATINVANMGGTITKVSVTLSNLSHTFPDDVDMLLVSPTGEKVTIMSDVGSTAANPNPISNVTLTLDSTAANPLPDAGPIVPGTFRPANYAGFGTADAFPPPAPPLPYTNASFTVLNGLVPNGNWSLYIVDAAAGDAGSLGAWSLSIQTSDPVVPPAPLITADVAVRASGPSGPVMLGGNFSCTFWVTNKGPATASAVALIDRLPAGLAFVSASVSAGTYKKVGTDLTWTVGNMERGATASITLVTRPLVAGAILNSVSVAANERDPNLADNTATMSASVAAGPALTSVRINNTLRLSWPMDSGFYLQATDSLRPANWVNVTAGVQQQNGQNIVSVVLTGGPKYYRLHSP